MAPVLNVHFVQEIVDFQGIELRAGRQLMEDARITLVFRLAGYASESCRALSLTKGAHEADLRVKVLGRIHGHINPRISSDLRLRRP